MVLHMILTSNKEVYHKLNYLNLTNKIVLKNTKFNQISRIIENFNRKDNCLKMTKKGNKIEILKMHPTRIECYFTGK